MGILSDLFGGSKAYQAQSGLRPGELEQMGKEREAATSKMAEFAAAVQPGGIQGLAAQQTLLPQLQAMAAGQGPSLVESMLDRIAGDIGTGTAAQIASARGASQNVGLAARQAARGSADIYQRMASELATARTREQMAAIEQLRQQAAQQALQYQTGTQAYGQQALEAQKMGLTAQAQQEQLRTEMAKQQESTRGGIVGGFLSGLGAAASGGVFSGGGGAKMAAAGPKGSNISDYTSLAEGGMVDQNDQRPQEEKAMDIVSLLLDSQPTGMAKGAIVPGKAKKDGDSYDNDTVPALLSPGEIVVPRSAAKDPEKAAAFAKSVAMRSKRRKK